MIIAFLFLTFLEDESKFLRETAGGNGSLRATLTNATIMFSSNQPDPRCDHASVSPLTWSIMYLIIENLTSPNCVLFG